MQTVTRRRLVQAAIGTMGWIALNQLQPNATAQETNGSTASPPPFSPASPSVSPSPTNSIANKLGRTLTGDHLFWIMLLIIMGPIVTILSVFLGPFIWSDDKLESRSKYLATVLPKLLEGITILLIISTVILSSILGVELPSGVLSLLAAIAGYVLGRSQSEQREANLNRRIKQMEQGDSQEQPPSSNPAPNSPASDQPLPPGLEQSGE